MSAVTERSDLRLATATQRNRVTRQLHQLTGLLAQYNRPADQVGTVLVGNDDDLGLRHVQLLPGDGRSKQLRAAARS
jgi:hypothetical protein